MRASKWLIVLICLAALLPAGRFARAEGEARDMGTLGSGAMAIVDLDAGPARLGFTPPAGSMYDFCAYPVEGPCEVRARLTQDGTLLGEGEGLLTLMSARLPAGEACEIELEGTGRVRLEAARHALSRCFDMPIALNAAGDRYAKAIARSGDAHWYLLEPGDGRGVVLAGVPGAAGLTLDAQLFDDAGALLAAAVRTPGGACLVDFTPEAGRSYRLRLTSPDGGTGLYGLTVARCEGGLPQTLALSADEIRLEGREKRALTARVLPAGSANVLFWESSDPNVVSADPDGVLTGRRSGTAVVTAYAAGAVRARCRVEVSEVPVTGVALLARRIEMNVGDDAALEWRVLPENASDQRVRFSVSPEGVAEVDRAGVLRAVGEGTALLTVRAEDGGFEATAEIVVAPALRRYRALLVGEQSYAATVASARPGSANSVAGLRSMLGELSYGGARFEIATRLDVSRDGVLGAVRDCLGDATARDVSLFYITCHGYYASGMTFFQMYDGSVLSAWELRAALNRVPGEVIALIDCCGSGGVIGRAGVPSDILSGIDAVFGGQLGAPLMDSSKFRVLASASLEQESYRISLSGGASESGTATVFARAVCEGGGWSIDRAARGPMRADLNYDDVVTLEELYAYASRRVMRYLGLSGQGYVQTVQVCPRGDVNALFERTG